MLVYLAVRLASQVSRGQRKSRRDSSLTASPYVHLDSALYHRTTCSSLKPSSGLSRPYSMSHASILLNVGSSAPLTLAAAAGAGAPLVAEGAATDTVAAGVLHWHPRP